MAKSEYYAKKILGLLKGDAYTAPTPYLGLLKSDEGLAKGDGSETYDEVSGGSYARKSMVWGDIADKAMSLSANIDFGIASEDWGQVTHVAIFDASSAGNVLYWFPLIERPDIKKDGQFTVLAADCRIAEG